MTGPLYSSNRIIEGELDVRLGRVQDLTDADVMAYLGPITDSTPTLFKGTIEDAGTRHDRLVLILETNGGYVESAERIVNILRHHYTTVDFFILSHAMSAGTVLAMSGDSIHMDYSAVLGPIDPQIMRPGSSALVPALGYLEQYDRLVKRSAAGDLTSAELAYLVEKFDPAELYYYEQARDLSIALLKEWLVKYKFKNWTKTATRSKTVTNAMRQKRAEAIARQLNDTARWHSHSRGISMEVLRRELNLQVEDISDKADLHRELADYTSLLYDYRSKRGHYMFVLNWQGGYHGH